MIEFQSPVVEASIREICEQQGFRIEGHTLIVRGKCADCLKKQAERGDKQKLDLI
jgi:Fe2+ or Zn2+ uptake regulation protein